MRLLVLGSSGGSVDVGLVVGVVVGAVAVIVVVVVVVFLLCKFKFKRVRSCEPHHVARVLHPASFAEVLDASRRSDARQTTHQTRGEHAEDDATVARCEHDVSKRSANFDALVTERKNAT